MPGHCWRVWIAKAMKQVRKESANSLLEYSHVMDTPLLDIVLTARDKRKWTTLAAM